MSDFDPFPAKALHRDPDDSSLPRYTAESSLPYQPSESPAVVEAHHHEHIYHEKQLSLLCGVHALNNLLQGPLFGAGDLAEIAHWLDAKESALVGNFHERASPRVDPLTGDFSIEVLTTALDKHGIRLLNADHELVAEQVGSSPHEEEAFLCHQGAHWLTLRKLAGLWWDLNSQLDRPRLIDEASLTRHLAELRIAGHVVCVAQAMGGASLPMPRWRGNSRSAGHEEVWHPIDYLLAAQMEPQPPPLPPTFQAAIGLPGPLPSGQDAQRDEQQDAQQLQKVRMLLAPASAPMPTFASPVDGFPASKGAMVSKGKRTQFSRQLAGIPPPSLLPWTGYLIGDSMDGSIPLVACCLIVPPSNASNVVAPQPGGQEGAAVDACAFAAPPPFAAAIHFPRESSGIAHAPPTPAVPPAGTSSPQTAPLGLPSTEAAPTPLGPMLVEGVQSNETIFCQGYLRKKPVSSTVGRVQRRWLVLRADRIEWHAGEQESKQPAAAPLGDLRLSPTMLVGFDGSGREGQLTLVSRKYAGGDTDAQLYLLPDTKAPVLPRVNPLAHTASSQTPRCNFLSAQTVSSRRHALCSSIARTLTSPPCAFPSLSSWNFPSLTVRAAIITRM